MSNRIFSDILDQGLRQGILPEKSKEAQSWYQNAAKNYGATIRQGGKEAGRVDYARINEKKFLNEAGKLTSKIVPGRMYMGHYKAKWADELPYWDRFPIFLPFRVQSDRFFSVSLHHIDLRARAVLLDKLFEFTNNSKFDETTKMNFSYQTLKAASRMKMYEPCIKQYLFSQMQSLFMEVPPAAWTIAAFLPLERMVKKTKSQAWSDNRKRY